MHASRAQGSTHGSSTVPPLQGETSADLAPEQLRDMLDDGQDLLILDVCLAETSRGAPIRSPGQLPPAARRFPSGPATFPRTSRWSCPASTGSRSAARPSPSSVAEALTPGRSGAASPLGTPWAARPFRSRSQKEEVTTKWVTRERPKIDRIACPWLIRRFIDKDAEFFYVPTGRGA